MLTERRCHPFYAAASAYLTLFSAWHESKHYLAVVFFDTQEKNVPDINMA